MKRLNRILLGIKAFWIAFVIFPIAGVLIIAEEIWDYIVEKSIKRKTK